jgi:hypothetical protein
VNAPAALLDSGQAIHLETVMNARTAPLLLVLLLGTGAWAQRAEIYGSQFMTERERAEYWERMDAFRSEAERERYREQHAEWMRNRARDQGIDLDARGDGPGRGAGIGRGEPPGPGDGPGQRVGPYGEGGGPPGQERDFDDDRREGRDWDDDRGPPGMDRPAPGQGQGQGQGRGQGNR